MFRALECLKRGDERTKRKGEDVAKLPSHRQTDRQDVGIERHAGIT
jgi:hypothetical protein